MGGRAILYADRVTGSMEAAIHENERRRERQQQYNLINGITPESIKKNITNIMGSVYEKDHVTVDIDTPLLEGKALKDEVKKLEKSMLKAASDLDFETAARLRDEIKRLEIGALKA